MPLILGSSSPYRRQILESAGYQFSVMSPGIDEKAIRTDNPYELPLLLANAKADALMPRISEPSLVITTDQVVVCNGQLFEKPANDSEAHSFLLAYSDGHPAELVSALVVTDTATGKRVSGTDISKVHFDPIPEDTIAEFIAHGDPCSKSGGFAVESPILKPYINRIEGTVESVMGMPLELLKDLLIRVK